MTDKSKTLVWLRIEASDEARCDSKTRLEAIKPDWKQAQKSMKDAEEALLDAQSAAREEFPDQAYDEETSRALNGRIEHFEHMGAKFARIDSRKRSLADELKRLTEQTLKMLSESREPGIFDAGENLGPHAWKLVKLRDLTGGPDADKPMDNQVWVAQELEKAGYHTVGEFIQGRSRIISAMIDDGELATTTLELVDVAVYRFLENRNLLDMWPKGMNAPTGEQMALLQVADCANESTDEVGGNRGFDGLGSEANPSLKLVGEKSNLHMPTPTEMHPKNPKLRSASSERYEVLLESWRNIVNRAKVMGDGFNVDFDDDDYESLRKCVGGCPKIAMENILRHIEFGGEIPEPEGDRDVMEAIVECWVSIAEELGVGSNECDEFTGWFCKSVVGMGGDAVRRVSKWSASLGGLIDKFADFNAVNSAKSKKKSKKKSPEKTA